MNPRYTALPVIAVCLKAVAHLSLVAGVVAAACAAWRPMCGGWSGLGVFLFWLLATFAAYLFLLAFAEGIHVLLDIEENTRRAADQPAQGPRERTPAR